MTSERVKPDGERRWMGGHEDQFDRSTILRALDEEEAALDAQTDYPAAREVIARIRARFEEADEPQSVLGMEVRVSPYIPRNVIYVGREITPEKWRSMLRGADDDA